MTNTRKLRARWTGPPPRVGDYLMSSTRPRFGYRVCKVERVNPLVHWDPALKTEARRLTLTTKRIPAGTVPSTARIHPWRWDKREPRRKPCPAP